MYRNNERGYGKGCCYCEKIFLKDYKAYILCIRIMKRYMQRVFKKVAQSKIIKDKKHRRIKEVNINI
jgi:hypothetical protein